MTDPLPLLLILLLPPTELLRSAVKLKRELLGIEAFLPATPWLVPLSWTPASLPNGEGWTGELGSDAEGDMEPGDAVSRFDILVVIA